MAKQSEIERLGENVAAAKAETAAVEHKLHVTMQERDLADMRLCESNAAAHPTICKGCDAASVVGSRTHTQYTSHDRHTHTHATHTHTHTFAHTHTHTHTHT